MRFPRRSPLAQWPLLLFCLATLAAPARAQVAACCAKPAPTQAFAMLAADPSFIDKHEAPRPFRFAGAGEAVTFPVAGGPEGRGYLVRAADPQSTRWLLVIHEWWGLNDYIKREAARFAEELPGVNVLAVDLYDGAVATEGAEASKLVQAIKPARATGILKGATAFAGKTAHVASVGWCFGGGWSLQAALLNGPRAAGGVMYYGMPETDAAKLAPLQTSVLGIFAGRDKSITPKVVKDFEQAMQKAGKKLTVKTYDADHAFANPSNPHYVQDFAEEAHGIAVAFLKQQLTVAAR